MMKPSLSNLKKAVNKCKQLKKSGASSKYSKVTYLEYNNHC